MAFLATFREFLKSVCSDKTVNNKAILELISQYPFFTPIFLITKKFLSQFELNRNDKEGLSSYMLMHLVFFYVKRFYAAKGEVSKRDIGDLLIGFFDFYGWHFNFKTQKIDIDAKEIEFRQRQ